VGQRGPQPKPKVIRVPAGGVRPAGRIPRGAPDKPASLRGEASAEWDRIVPELEAAGLVARVDRAGLVAYCLAWAQMVWADASLQKDGPIISEPIQSAKGDVIGYHTKAHPANQIHSDASRRVAAWVDKFGLTPAARARLEGGGTVGGEAPAGNRVLAIRDRIQAARGGA
jgi:P27 family predicted phage terminase small subunit